MQIWSFLRSEESYNWRNVGGECNGILMANADRTSQMPLVRGRAARSIQSNLDAEHLKRSKRLFAT